MPRYIAAALPDGCPWSGWAPPNVDWCEAELCSVVVNPAGTWSNLAFIVFGIWMIMAARREPNRALALFGPASLFVGATSFAYHASYTAFFQFFDFVGMFIFCMTIIAVNAVRLGWVPASGAWKLGLAGVVGSSLLMPVLAETPVPIQATVVLLILFILGQEVLAYTREADGPEPVSRRFLWCSLALIVAAAGCSASDVSRTVCNPNDHVFQGHALWHLLSAASLVAIFLYQRNLGRRAKVSN